MFKHTGRQNACTYPPYASIVISIDNYGNIFLTYQQILHSTFLIWDKIQNRTEKQMGWNGGGVGSRALSCNKRILGDKKLNDIWELVLYDVITYFTAVLF